MATRSERRRRQRQTASDGRNAGHGETMLSGIVKSRDSKQLRPKTDLFTDMYDKAKAVAPPYPLQSLLELSKVNAVHSGCIEAKVADAVGRGWKLVPEDDTEDGVDADVDKVTRLAKDKLKTLCPKLPFKALIRQAIRELEKTGWGLIEVGREGEEIAALWPMPPQNVRATKDEDVVVQVIGDKTVFYMRFGAGPAEGVRGRVSAKHGHKDWGDDAEPVDEDDVANEVIIFMHYSEETPYYGVPPWVSGVPAIAELTSIREFNVSFFESGGQADRLIHVAGALEASKKLAEDIGKQIEESRGRAHISLTTFSDENTTVEVTPLSNAASDGGKKDRAFAQGREDLAKELLIAHQVPASRIAWSITGSLGGEQAGEELDAYRYGVIEPLQELAEEELERTLFNKVRGGLDLFSGYLFEFEDLDWTNKAEQTAQAETMVDKGMATPNEGRVMMGEDPSDDPRADLLYYAGVPLGTSAGAAVAGAAGSQGDAQGVLAELRDAVRTSLQAHEESLAQTETKKSRWTLVSKRKPSDAEATLPA